MLNIYHYIPISAHKVNIQFVKNKMLLSDRWQMPAQELFWSLTLINDQVCPSRSKSASSKERKFHGRDWTFEAEAPASSIQNCLLSGWFRNKSFCRRRMQATYSEIPQF